MKNRVNNILMVGVGGQGIILASDIVDIMHDIRFESGVPQL